MFLILLLIGAAAPSSTKTGDYEQNREPFVCKAVGRFEDPNDVSCKTFYHCIECKGALVPTQFSCSPFTNFDPVLQMCSFTYPCPLDRKGNGCIEDSSEDVDNGLGVNEGHEEVVSSCTPFTCNSEGVFEDPDNCGMYYVCSKLYDTYVAAHHPCPLFAGFDPTYNMCSFAKTCSPKRQRCIQQILQDHDHDICTYMDSRDYFNCTSPGRYANLNDPSCQTYHSCVSLQSGRLSKSLKRCPKGSYFNPHLRYCDTNYRCPCSGSQSYDTVNVRRSASNTDFECPAKGRFADLTDPTCQSYFLCNLLRNGSLVRARYSCPESSAFNPRLGICDSRYECPSTEATTTATSDTNSSICTEKGRFDDPDDLTCRSYFLCSLLRNGTFVRTKYSCPGSTRFNPDLGVCDTKYTCPYDTTPATESSSDACRYSEDPDYFTCTAGGRFEDLNDPTCRSYLLCNLLSNGSFVKTKYTCPSGARFNPSTSICDTKYDCPCSTYTTPTTTSTSSTSSCRYSEDPDYFTCTSGGRFEDLNDPTCRSYLLCNLLRNGSFVKTKYTCPSGARFNPFTSICDTKYDCPCSTYTTSTTSTTTSSEELCRYEESPDYFRCSEKGRFENRNDLTCQSYFLCSQLRNSSFVQTMYLCPNGSKFNPSAGICDVRYSCPCDYRSTITTEASSTSSEEVCRYNEDPNYFQCTSKGRFPNLNDLTCRSYFLCIRLRNGTFIQTLYLCPHPSNFNPQRGLCDATYNCPCEDTPTTTSISTTINSDEDRCIYEDDPGYFECTQRGRFENRNDLTCRSYFLCVQLRNGSFVQSKYTCPDSSNFNPSLGICDRTYTCPCGDQTGSTECVYEEDPEYFQCVGAGRFPNLNDPTCQSYFLCNRLGNGTFVTTKYPCPNGSKFNPALGRCDGSYKCPCDGLIF